MRLQKDGRSRAVRERLQMLNHTKGKLNMSTNKKELARLLFGTDEKQSGKSGRPGKTGKSDRKEYNLEEMTIEQIKLYIQKAPDDTNRAELLLFLGNTYLEGRKGIPRDFKEAYKNFLFAANLGHQGAQYNVALMIDDILFKGKYGKHKLPLQNPEKTYLEILAKVCKGSDKKLAAEAHAKIGLHQFDSVTDKTLEINKHTLKLAFDNFKSSAELMPTPVGLYYLGICKEDGYGTAKNVHQAFGHYCEAFALDTNNAEFAYKIATFYEFGYGVVPISIKNAAKFYDQARKLGSEKATFQLCIICLQNRAIEQTRTQGLEYLNSLKDVADPDIQFKMGQLFEKGVLGIEKSPMRAFECFVNATVRGGLAEAWEKVAMCYLRGFGVAQNINKAFEICNNPELKLEIEAELRKELAQQMYEAALGFLTGISVQGKTLERNSAKALEYLNKAVQEKSVAAQNLLALCLIRPSDFGLMGIKSDQKRGLQLLKEIEKVSLDAANNLGWCNLSGIAVKQNEKAGFEYFESASKKGNLTAKLNLALIYILGLGIEADPDYGFELMSEVDTEIANQDEAMENVGRDLLQFGFCHMPSAKETVLPIKSGLIDILANPIWKENRDILYHIGCFYLYGNGIASNPERAFEFFSKASEKGQKSAKFELGRAHAEGLGVAVNTDLAFKIHDENSAENVDSLLYLARMTLNGKGRYAKSEALKMFRFAMAHGWEDAMAHLGYCYEVGLAGLRPNPSEALRLYKQAAAKESALACYYAGRCLERQKEKDPAHMKEAIQFYSQGALAGNAWCLNRMGSFYEKEKNPKKAFSSFYLAAKYHHPEAQFNLARCYEKGIGTAVLLNQALYWYEKASLGCNDAKLAYKKLQKSITSPEILRFSRKDITKVFTEERQVLALAKKGAGEANPDAAKKEAVSEVEKSVAVLEKSESTKVKNHKTNGMNGIRKFY